MFFNFFSPLAKGLGLDDPKIKKQQYWHFLKNIILQKCS